jgi:hypothetical protein
LKKLENTAERRLVEKLTQAEAKAVLEHLEWLRRQRNDLLGRCVFED